MKLIKKLNRILSGDTCKKLIATKKAIKLQDVKFVENKKKWIKDKELVVFFVLSKTCISGGIMSIFNIAKASRLFNKNVIIMTLHKRHTHTENNFFRNDEFIYRYKQLFDICDDLDKLILHIPEILVKDFNKLLTPVYIKKLKKIKDLQINIMNQNIELMPDANEIKKLSIVTKNVTQTTVHSAYANQENADKYGIVTHFLLTYIDMSEYRPVNFSSKEKIIVLSPDINEHREEVVTLLRNAFSDFKLVTVKDMTYDQYMELISKSFAVITFGEGFDAYFMEPPKVGTISFSVYNDDFFPSKDWTGLRNVYGSWDDLKNNLVKDLANYIEDSNLYYEIISPHRDCEFNINQKDVFFDNVKRFYQKEYDFYPYNKE